MSYEFVRVLVGPAVYTEKRGCSYFPACVSQFLVPGTCGLYLFNLFTAQAAAIFKLEKNETTLACCGLSTE